MGRPLRVVGIVLVFLHAEAPACAAGDVGSPSFGALSLDTQPASQSNGVIGVTL